MFVMGKKETTLNHSKDQHYVTSTCPTKRAKHRVPVLKRIAQDCDDPGVPSTFLHSLLPAVPVYRSHQMWPIGHVLPSKPSHSWICSITCTKYFGSGACCRIDHMVNKNCVWLLGNSNSWTNLVNQLTNMYIKKKTLPDSNQSETDFIPVNCSTPSLPYSITHTSHCPSSYWIHLFCILYPA